MGQVRCCMKRQSLVSYIYFDSVVVTKTNFNFCYIFIIGKRDIIKRAISFLNEIDKGSLDINVQDAFDRTPLFVAAKAGHAECVRELLAAGADKMIKAKTKKLDIVVVGDDTKSRYHCDLGKTPGVVFSMDEMQLTLKENSGWIGQVMVPDMAVNVEKKQADTIAEIDDQVEFMFSISEQVHV